MNKSVDELILWLGLELGEIYVSTTKWWYKLCYKEDRGYYFEVKDSLSLSPYSDFNNTKEITALTLHQLLNLRKLRDVI